MAAGLLGLFVGLAVLASQPGRGHDVWLPISVHVALVGFDDDLPINAGQLRRLLESALPLVQPTLVETGEAFEAQYVISYAVHHTDEAQRLALQDAVISAANAQPQAFVATIRGAERSVVDVDATRLEGAYATLREELLAGGGGSGAAAEDDAYLVVVQRLDTDAMSPRLPAAHSRENPTLHRYRYAGSTPTQAFIGAGRFLVVDLSSAPCSAGMLNADEGTVTADLLPFLARPRPAASADERRVAAVAALRAAAALVLHAVRFVLAPSVRFCAGAQSAGRVLVPIIALRNHEDFDPLAPLGSAAGGSAASGGDGSGGGSGSGWADGSVDVAAVRAQAERWMLPGQHLELVTSTHPLHSHPSLAIALARSVRSATAHEIFGGRKFRPVARPFVDAAELLARLRDSADALGGDLLRAGEGGAEAAAAAAATLVRAARGGSAGGGRDGATGDEAEDGVDGAADGSRLLPVYLLSLRGEDPRLALRADLVGYTPAESGYGRNGHGGYDHGRDVHGGARASAAAAAGPAAHGRAEAGLLSVSPSAIVVLQPLQPFSPARPGAAQASGGAGARAQPRGVALGLYSEDGPLAVDGERDATQQLLAGLLAGLGGVLPPHERFNAELGRVESSYLWAVGAHPFGRPAPGWLPRLRAPAARCLRLSLPRLRSGVRACNVPRLLRLLWLLRLPSLPPSALPLSPSHPPGPFSRSLDTSSILADAAVRNCLLCGFRAAEQRLDAAEAAVRALLPLAASCCDDDCRGSGRRGGLATGLATARLPTPRLPFPPAQADQLAHDFLAAQLPRRSEATAAALRANGSLAADPPLPPWAGQAGRAWQLYNRGQLPDSMPAAYVLKLYPPILKFRAQLAALHGAVEARGASSKADVSSRLASLLVATGALARHAQAEARAAREELACCALSHSVRLPFSARAQLLLGALGVLGAIAGALRALRGPQQRKQVGMVFARRRPAPRI